ncbi:TniQ family protein [Sulfitobacter sp. 1A15106]|jgi:hypothetical protein|uniref:TniQ family protein n=1 Tax=Sulfitobacter sp. 1A15106 TaxID=3368590 RepID=UPI00374774B0
MPSVTIELHDDELFIGYLSRYARGLGLSGVFDLLLDLSVPRKGTLNGAAEDIQKISAILGADVDRAMRQTFQKGAGKDVLFGGHLFQDQRLRRGQFRVCPGCLRDDIGAELTENTALNAYARMAWSVNSFRVCPQHHLFLIHPPEPGPPHEFNQTWEAWLPEILDGDLDQESKCDALYERHITRVLAGENSALGWADVFPLDALGALCEILGVAKVFDPNRQFADCTPVDIAQAMDEGFATFSAGRDAVLDLLMALRTRPGEPQLRPQGRYGPVHDWLKRGAGSAPEFAPMKELLRDHILETWALAPGTDVLGQPLQKRKFHSVLSAAHEHGLRPQKVINLLNDAGAIGALDLPEAERLYSVDVVEVVVGAVSGAISMSKAERFLGVTRTQMQTLIAAGYLTHSIGGDHARPRFSKADIDCFLERHLCFPVKKDIPAPFRWYDIATAARKYGVSVATVYGAVLSGKLPNTTRATDFTLFSQIRIDPLEAEQVFSTENRVDWKAIGNVSKEIGISASFLRELSERGYLELRDTDDERTHQRKTLVNCDTLDAFVETYVSRRLLARRNNVQVREVQKRMDAAGILILEYSADGTEWIVEQELISHVDGLNGRRGTI